MNASRLVAVLFGMGLAACGDLPEPYVIPGPTAPTAVTRQPLTWDSRDELLQWVANGVTHGPITVEGEGAGAFIRVRMDFGNYLMRGPNLDPPADGVRNARIRVRFRHDRPRPPGAVQTEYFELFFDVVKPMPPNTQPSMTEAVRPSEDWQDIALRPALYCCLAPITVRYGYVPFRSTSPATLEIDRIELTR